MLFSHIPFLSFLILIPLLGTIFLYYMPRQVDRSNILHVSFLTSGSTLCVAALVTGLFKHGSPAFQFIDRMRFYDGAWGLYAVGVDRVSVFFVLAITLVYPLVVYAAYIMVKKNLRRFMILLFYVQSLLLGTCVSLNVQLFFLFSELLVLPLFFLIGIWGERAHMKDAYRSICLWGIGSVLFLMGIISLPVEEGNFEIPSWGRGVRETVALFWIGAFCVRLPFVPVGRLWERMVNLANPLMSALIAGAFVSVSFYGMMRLLVGWFPVGQMSHSLFLFFGAILLLLLSFVRMWRSHLLKQKIAYFYVFQIILMFIGFLSTPPEGQPLFLRWAIVHIPMVLFMFLALGFLHDRLSSDMITDFHGLYQVMPRLSNALLAAFVLSVLYPIFLLGSTFIKVVGAPQPFHFIGIIGLMGLGALGVQLLRVHAALCLGPVTSTTVWGMKDVKRGEWRLLCAVLLCMGVFMGWGLTPFSPLDFKLFPESFSERGV